MADEPPPLPDLTQYEDYLAVRIRTFEAKDALDQLIHGYQEVLETHPTLIVATLQSDLLSLAAKLIPDPPENP